MTTECYMVFFCSGGVSRGLISSRAQRVNQAGRLISRNPTRGCTAQDQFKIDRGFTYCSPSFHWDADSTVSSAAPSDSALRSSDEAPRAADRSTEPRASSTKAAPRYVLSCISILICKQSSNRYVHLSPFVFSAFFSLVHASIWIKCFVGTKGFTRSNSLLEKQRNGPC